ncbi:nucleoside-diphosphate-sugar epimerase [Thermocatellispora tengchongensis]|uniref:Nucleoside-diphosphate-sugar epimerase n=1 Tax=Thermocatellispora tengchongensis TaxID=1073253 RepID=A0A840P6J3_9ACTN|nr:NmrA family NAD(P)-binding protein [Thermocatellispora tengchongensis]MBB5133471.1 nucleoside-diphosphate-sugar epimerase [Thermocatellispora tengchongensis]
MFTSEAELEDRLATPSDGLVADLAGMSGDLVVLGAGGKMGPSLVRLARRGLDAADRKGTRVYAVSRWSDGATAEALAQEGIDVVRHDLLGDDGLAGLPDAANVVFMAGAKFGTSAAPYQSWVVNAALPAAVARRYRDSAIVAFSTGNVYPLVDVAGGGSAEGDPPGPVGEYAMSCLGRERIFEHAAATRGTPVAVLRLNYAVDLRYGVLADLAVTLAAGEPVDLTTGHVNVVWQGYANEVALRSLRHAAAPEPFTLNLTGPETATVRRVATRLAAALGVEAVFTGTEAGTALLNDATRCHGLFGYPDVPLDTLIGWQADWIARGLPLSGKPTKFAVRDGRF